MTKCISFHNTQPHCSKSRNRKTFWVFFWRTAFSVSSYAGVTNF